MIAGFGIDLVDIRRMARMHERFRERLAQRLLSAGELPGYESAAEPARFLAKRFAAKEAAAKALRCGIAQGVRFTDFRVDHEPGGAPLLQLEGAAKHRAHSLGISRAHLTLSDERDHVVACVILERR